jgi:hypothetical protein
MSALGHRVGSAMVVGVACRIAVGNAEHDLAARYAAGDFEIAAVIAEEAVDLITDIAPAADILECMVTEAAGLLHGASNRYRALLFLLSRRRSDVQTGTLPCVAALIWNKAQQIGEVAFQNERAIHLPMPGNGRERSAHLRR